MTFVGTAAAGGSASCSAMAYTELAEYAASGMMALWRLAVLWR